MKKSILKLGKNLNTTQLKNIKGSFNISKMCCEWCSNGLNSYCLDWVEFGVTCPISIGCAS